LACGDQRRLTGNGSALEVVLHDYALYKSTFTLLYFTLTNTDLRPHSIILASSKPGCKPGFRPGLQPDFDKFVWVCDTLLTSFRLFCRKPGREPQQVRWFVRVLER